MPLTTLALLKGKKTYLVAFAAAVVVALHLTGHISEASEDELLKALGAAGVTTLAAKINRLSGD